MFVSCLGRSLGSPPTWQTEVQAVQPAVHEPGFAALCRQWYTARPGNVRIEGGQLVIQALWEDPPTLHGKVC